MPRARTLFLVLVLLGVAATVGCGVVPRALLWPARLALVFGLPFAASIAATLLLPRESGREGASVKVAGTSRFLPVIALAIALDLGAVGAGFGLGLVSFAFGAQAHEPFKLFVAALALPFTIAAATLGTEWALHARLWESLSRAGRPREATLAALAAGVALAVPASAPGFSAHDNVFVAAGVTLALLREATALALFRAGGLFVAGAWRGALVGLEAFALGDRSSFLLPLATYVSSEPRFYLVRVAGGAAALLVVLGACRRRAGAAP